MGESENGRLSSSEDSPIPRSVQPVKKKWEDGLHGEEGLGVLAGRPVPRNDPRVGRCSRGRLSLECYLNGGETGRPSAWAENIQTVIGAEGRERTTGGPRLTGARKNRVGCRKEVSARWSGSGGSAEHPRGIERRLGVLEAEEEFEELAGDGGHRFAAAHAGVSFTVIVLTVKLTTDDAFEDGLGEHVSQPRASAFGLSLLALHRTALVRPQVETAVAPELAESLKVRQRPGLTQNAGEHERTDQIGLRLEARRAAGVQRGGESDHLRACRLHADTQAP